MQSRNRFAANDRTMGGIITVNARRSPGRTALKQDGRVLSYADLDQRTNRLAHGLLAAGHRPGDRISAWMEDGTEFVELLIAAAKAGVTISPISKMFTPREARIQIEDADTSALIFTPGVAGRVEELGLDKGFRLYTAAGAPPVGDATALEDLTAGGSTAALEPRDPDELVLIAYTSGTTGRPKGSMFTHETIRSMLRMQSVSYRLPLYGTAVFNSSMSFVGTITAFIWSHFYIGGTVVMAPGLDVPGQLDVVERERGTFMYLPTPSMEEFVDAVKARPGAVDSIVSILHSGSKAPRATVERVCEAIGHRYLEGYGQTENSGGLMAATTAADSLGLSAARDVHASGGRPTIGVLMDILDADGEPLPHDGTTMGELVYQSPGLMTGYWRNERATADAFRGEWFASGDLATIDEAGYIYIIDRRSDLIVSGGANVSPLEVEEVVLAHPDVAECVAVAAPHERWGQMVVAVVVPRAGRALTEDAVREHCRGALASYKIPKRVLFTDGFTYSASHKVRRFQVRDWVAERLADGA